MNIAIKIKNLHKKYPGNSTFAINNLTADIEYGKMVALLGANGSGKSTLIHLIVGALKPSQGEVKVFEELPYKVTWASQFPSIDWFLTVQDNVEIGALLGKKSEIECKKRAKKYLKILEIENLANRLPDQLSGGQQQRMRIARALAQDGNILILDEPTTGMDPVAAEKTLQYIKSKLAKDKLIIISGHDLGLLEKYSDQVMCLKEGILVAYEDKSDFIKKFTMTGIMEVHYEGKYNQDIDNELMAMEIRVISKDPLQLELSNNTNIKAIISVLSKRLTITALSQKPQTLTDAFKKINTN